MADEKTQDEKGNVIDLLNKINEKLNKEDVYFESSPHPPKIECQFTEKEVEKAATSQQDGDAWLYHQMHKGKICYDHAAKRYYEFHEHHWREDETEEYLKKIEPLTDIYSLYVSHIQWRKTNAVKHKRIEEKEALEKLEKTYLKKIGCLQKRAWKRDVIEIACAGKNSLGITGREWDSDPWLLGCKNGVLDLRTGSLRQGKPEDYIKMVSPTEWKGLYEPCPTWEKFLNDIYDEDFKLIYFIQKLLGYCTTGIVKEHVFPVFHGPEGRNGKGTLVNSIVYTMGPYADVIKPEMLLEQNKTKSSSSPNPDLMGLRGMRMLFASETNDGERLNMGKIKAMSGGNILKGRELYAKRDISFTPTHKLFLETNHKPKADPNDNAFWDRLILIPFNKRFIDFPQKPNERKRDYSLPDKLKSEASGILAWLAIGCLEWQKSGLNPYPDIVKMATSEYREGEDIIGQFLSERCTIDSNMYVTAGALYKAYSEEWCKEYGYNHPISNNKFSDYISKSFKRDDSGRHRIYRGIGLKDEF